MVQKEMYEKILSWLVESKIRENSGTVYSWLNSQNPGYIYPEIIGYYIKLFSYLYNIERKKKFKEIILSSADYISSILSKNGSVSRGGIEYVFDTGICLSGIISLDKNCLLKENHETAMEKMARFVRKSLLNKIPSFKDGSPVLDNSIWSLSYGSLLIKTAISLFEYGKYINNLEYIEFMENMVKEIVDSTFKKDHFSINGFYDWVYSHPHCYATEGLCFLYENGYKEYLDIIQKSAHWLSNVQNNDGSINNWYYRDNISKEKQGDATAQSIRIWLYVDKIKYKENIDKAISFLKTLQSSSGGLYYNNRSKDVNSWVSMFALQALYWNINNMVDFNWIV